jgi:hypothetical protein
VKRRILLAVAALVGGAVAAAGAAVLQLHYLSLRLADEAGGCPNGCPCWADIDDLPPI